MSSDSDSSKPDASEKRIENLPSYDSVQTDDAHDQAEEKRLIRKVDWRLLPILGALYSIALIDRTNVSSASIPSFLPSFIPSYILTQSHTLYTTTYLRYSYSNIIQFSNAKGFCRYPTRASLVWDETWPCNSETDIPSCSSYFSRPISCSNSRPTLCLEKLGAQTGLPSLRCHGAQ